MKINLTNHIKEVNEQIIEEEHAFQDERNNNNYILESIFTKTERNIQFSIRSQESESTNKV